MRVMSPKKKIFSGALYDNLANALKSKDVTVYGHDDNTMAGYNCSWVQHDSKVQEGRKAKMQVARSEWQNDLDPKS